MRIGIPPATDSSAAILSRATTSKAASMKLAALATPWSEPCWSPATSSADFGGELADDVTYVRREFGVLRGRLAFQSPERHGQFD